MQRLSYYLQRGGCTFYYHLRLFRVEAMDLITSCREFISYRYDNVKSTSDWKHLSKATKKKLKVLKKEGVWIDESGILELLVIF